MVRTFGNAQPRDIKAKDISFRGTGITKRELERAESSAQRAEEKSLNKGADLASAQASAKFEQAIHETTEAFIAEAKAKNIILDPSQLAALRGMFKQQVCCLIGAAGTGKTTLEKMYIAEMTKRVKTVHVVYDENEDGEIGSDEEKEKDAPAISVSAFTGRASQMSRKAIGETFGVPIQTIHSLLGYAPTVETYDYFDPISRTWGQKERKIFRPSFGQACKLPYQVYIIDEASMVPIPLFNELIDAIHPTSRIVLVGDIHQLPPVYSKSVLGYALQKWPVFELTTIHRQATGNAIITNAHNVLNGRNLMKAPNFHLLEAPIAAQGSSGFQTYIRAVVQKLYDVKRFDPYRDAIIVPNSDPDILISAPALNNFFVTMFNGEKTENGVVINKRIKIHTGTQHCAYAIGDKIMMGQNINTVSPPITNGMMGIIEDIKLNGKYDMKRAQVDVLDDEPDNDDIELDFDALEFSLDASIEKGKDKADEGMDQRQASHVVTIKFETGQTFICSTSGDYRKISFGYACTCHKMQGGEAPKVVIAIHSASGQLLSQEWLYTAITRARNEVFLIYNKRALERALKTQKIKGKTLKEKIASYIIEAKASDMQNANDPWNVDREKFPILFNPKEV